MIALDTSNTRKVLFVLYFEPNMMEAQFERNTMPNVWLRGGL